MSEQKNGNCQEGKPRKTKILGKNVTKNFRQLLKETSHITLTFLKRLKMETGKKEKRLPISELRVKFQPQTDMLKGHRTTVSKKIKKMERIH